MKGLPLGLMLSISCFAQKRNSTINQGAPEMQLKQLLQSSARMEKDLLISSEQHSTAHRLDPPPSFVPLLNRHPPIRPALPSRFQVARATFQRS